MSSKVGQPRVVIVGAGLGGISAAIALKRQLGFSNFKIYEKGSSIGGTWRDNTYPGCGSDVPGHWYSLSTELNPNWSHVYVGQAEILEYWKGVSNKHNLAAHTVLNSLVGSAAWDDIAQLYRFNVQSTITGETTEQEAEMLIFAIGGFFELQYPKEVTGLETFGGQIWHSARWNHDVDMKGKRVGVIGNGCSAAQFIPIISEDPTVHVFNFCRTPQWYMPRLDREYSPRLKWVFANIPFVMRCYRNALMALSDIGFLAFHKSYPGVMSMARKRMTKYITKHAPKSQLKHMIPSYPPGCKRIILDPGYLDSLKRPNVQIDWTGLQEIVKDGVKLKTGEIIPLDVIIFATGYSIDPGPSLAQVRGRHGRTMQEWFDSRGGATAYLGSFSPGFPNLVSVLGPNVAVGHASLIFSEEVQINLIMKMIKPILSGSMKSFEVSESATNEYNSWLQKRLSNSVWVDCNSYYHVGGRGENKIVATFPGPVLLFWWLARKPRWEKFRLVGADRLIRQQRRSKLLSRVFSVLLTISLIGYSFYGCVFRSTFSRFIEASPFTRFLFGRIP